MFIDISNEFLYKVLELSNLLTFSVSQKNNLLTFSYKKTNITLCYKFLILLENWYFSSINSKFIYKFFVIF